MISEKVFSPAVRSRKKSGAQPQKNYTYGASRPEEHMDSPACGAQPQKICAYGRRPSKKNAGYLYNA